MPFLRVFLVLAVTAVLGWLTVGVGVANLMRSARPETALAFFPFDARARANLAEKATVELVRDRSRADEIGRLARAALARDPTIIDAWRLVGVVAGVREQADRATGTLKFAERISRRDLPVQLWLIEDRVRRDDVVGALRHYDVALRTSPTSRQLLFPILVAASAEASVARPLAQLLARNPQWRREFAAQLTHSTAKGDTIPLLVAQMADTPYEREIMTPMVQRLATAGDYRNAWAVYRLLKGARPAPPEPLRDGDFSTVPAVAPFDWFMANEGAIRAERRIRDNSGDDAALFVSAEAGTAGDGARQLLLLAPGTYELAAAIGSVPDMAAATVELRVACAGEPPRILAQASHVPTQVTGSRQSLRFAIPSGCPAQVLTMGVRSQGEVGTSEAWIDKISVSRT